MHFPHLRVGTARHWSTAQHKLLALKDCKFKAIRAGPSRERTPRDRGAGVRRLARGVRLPRSGRGNIETMILRCPVRARLLECGIRSAYGCVCLELTNGYACTQARQKYARSVLDIVVQRCCCRRASEHARRGGGESSSTECTRFRTERAHSLFTGVTAIGGR
ncbi:hypothetical protein HYPSUDRAFT_817634 [Hypholoma sublateritium FD-334 SS-4]|uniref:Uncharacterized protein n=1 Tax=Hypholoma sublateritium (strain FD-334 SS-4) TaxID=945553 RepID=A0A0D2PK60_HYPSF|nr:hypothetical protein HYPSUDRAFT_817634 [Hypholoma sublateritium FD-334 SS-4]